jgi:hypothetical protein
MGKISKFDALEWVHSVKEHCGSTFYFDELPEELRNKAALIKARHIGAIKVIDRRYIRRTLKKRWRIVI